LESSWRRRWWELGGGYAFDIIGLVWPEQVLASQVRIDPTRLLSNIGAFGGLGKLLADVDVGTQYITFVGVFFPPSTHPHFPYGFDVLPDAHG
jgi:hypothetical protein